MKKRILSLFLALILCLTLAPAGAAASAKPAGASGDNASVRDAIRELEEPQLNAAPEEAQTAAETANPPEAEKPESEQADPTEAAAAELAPASGGGESVWDAIRALEAERLPNGGDEAAYAALTPDVEALVTARADYVPGTVLYQDDILCWETTDGNANGYFPSLRSQKAAEARLAAEAEPLPEAEPAEVTQILAEAKKTAGLRSIGQKTYYDAAFISPHFNEVVGIYRFDLTGFYKIQEVAKYTHGNYEAYFNTDATIDNIASAIQHCCVVVINTHGTKTGYIDLTTSKGITQKDRNKDETCAGGHYYHALFGDDDTVQVDGVCIANHMTGPAAGGLVYLGCCHSMRTTALEAPLREAGVGVVLGFSRSVHHKFDDLVMEEFLDALAKGKNVKDASQRMRERLVKRTGLADRSIVFWDPWISKVGDLLSLTEQQARDHDAAFIWITSDDDPYPTGEYGTQCKQVVTSTWELPWREGWWTQDIEIAAPVGAKFRKYFGNAWVKKVEGTARLRNPEQLPSSVGIGVMQINDGGKKLYYSFFDGMFLSPGYWESEVELTTGDGVREVRNIRLMAYSEEPSRTEEESTIYEIGHRLSSDMMWTVMPGEPYSVTLLSGKLPEGCWLRNQFVRGEPKETGVFTSTWRVITWYGETYDLKLTLTVTGETVFNNQTVNEKEGQVTSVNLETFDGSGVYHIEEYGGALPPGMRLEYSQSESACIVGQCDTVGDYEVKFRIVTGSFKTVIHTIHFHIYRAIHELDYLRLDLTSGTAYLTDAQYRCVRTNLLYAGESGQITANNLFFDLDKDGRIDIGLHDDSKTIRLGENNSLTEDFFVLEMNGDTRRLLNDAGERLWYETLNFLVAEPYMLVIDGTTVTSRNRSNVLKNGVFSFDGLSTLTIRGDYTGKTTEPLIESSIPNLTIRTEKDVTLSAKDTGILAAAPTTITGSGQLTLKAGGAGVLCKQEFMGRPDLTIDDVSLRIDAGTSALLCVDAGNKCTLTVIGSNLELKGATSAADGFEDIKLYRDVVTKPLQGSHIYNGSLRDENYKLLQEAEISAYNEAYDLVIDGVQVTDSNRLDVLKNGVFLYDDKANTLIVRGSYTGGEAYGNNLIESRIADLTITAMPNTTLTGAGPFVLWLQGADATILGGPLTLKCPWGRAAICVDSASLSVFDAELKLESDGDYGILARESGNDVEIEHSAVEISAATSCVHVYGSFASPDCDLTGGELHADSNLSELVNPDDSSKPATHVIFGANRRYGVHIDGTELTERGMEVEPLPDAFDYDPGTNTLTVKGSYTAVNDEIIWNENSPGLTVRVEKDATLTGTEDDAALYFWENTTLTGPGTLTLNGECSYALGARGNPVVTLDGATVIADGAVRGIYGYPKLVLKDAVLTATAKPGYYSTLGAVCGFQNWGSWGGIELTHSEILAPKEGTILNGTVRNGEGEPAAEVRIGRGYGLSVDNVAVTPANCADVLNNGAFSYDAESKTLTVRKDYTSSGSMILSDVQGLTLYVEKDVTLTYPDMMGGELLYFNGDTTITGPGRLTLVSPRDCIAVAGGAELRIENAAVDARSELYGGVRGSGRREKLTLSGTELYASGDYGGVTGFGGGFDPGSCVILTPAGGVFDSNTGAIVDADGNVAKEVSLGARRNPFVDVQESNYFYTPVLWAVNCVPQITNGTDATHFAPNTTCTRAQVVTFLWRAKGCPEPSTAESIFADVQNPKAYYYKAVLWAVENGITNGVDDTHFGPDQGCTRGQVVTFLWRTEGEPAPMSSANPFADVTGGFYYNAVLWAVEKNITKGTDATHFSPAATCTRGQIVTFLYRDLVG